jgi:hypothetical protein
MPLKRPFGPAMLFRGKIQGIEVERRGHLRALWDQGIALIQAADGPQNWPPHFFVRQWDRVRYGRALAVAWNHGRRFVPREFKLQQRLAPDLIDLCLHLNQEEWITFEATLRKEGFLAPLPALNRKSLPPGVAWDELVRLYLWQEGDIKPGA